MSSSTSRVTLAGLALAAGLVGCTDTKTIATPIPDGQRAGQIELNPVFSQTARTVATNLADFGLSYDRVRITVRNNPDTTMIVLDTTIAFGSSSNDLILNLTVPVNIHGQVFNTRVQYAGDSGVLYAGAVVVKSHAPGQAVAPQAPLRLNYVGPGAKVKTISISPDPVQLVGETALPLTMTATDSSGAAIATPPLMFASSDASVAAIGATSSNRVVRSFGRRGTVMLTAVSPTGIGDTLSAVVTLPAASIVLVTGGDQSGSVGGDLTKPAIVQVNATDGAGVAGVPVTFAAPVGGAVATTSTTTDADGRASTAMTLATGAGPQSFIATAAGLSVVIPATAVAGPPSPATSTISSSVAKLSADNTTPATITVQARDQYGNVITRGGAVVRLTTSFGHFGPIGAVTTIDATDHGDGTYTAQLFSSRAGTATITATLGGTSIATPAATVKVSALTPASIALVSGGEQHGAVGTKLTAPVVVQVESADGAGLPDVPVTFSAPSGGSVGTPTATTDANGRASTTVTLATGAGAQNFTATAGGFSVTIPENAAAGPASATTSTIAASSSSINADDATPATITVHAKDQYGNVATTGGAKVTLTTTLGHWGSGSATTTTAADAGDGTYTATLLSAQSGSATITGTVGGIAIATPPLSINAVATVVDHFDITLANGSPISGNLPAGVATPVKITARDLSGNVVTSYARQTTVSATNSSLVGGSPGITAPAAVGGVISMTVKFGAIASNVMLNATDGTKAGHSTAFNVVAGPAVSIAPSDGNKTIVYSMNQAPAVYPSVKVTDALGDPAGNQTVAFTVTAPCTLSAARLNTNAAGTIAFGASTLTIPVLGAMSPFSCELVATGVGFTAPALHMALLVQPSGSTVWTGRVDNAWETHDNWTLGVPSTAMSAFIAAAQPSTPGVYPVLHGAAAVPSIDVEDRAQLDLNGKTLSVFQNVDARTNGVIRNGTIIVPVGANGGGVRGTLPDVNCQSGQYSLIGVAQLTGALSLSNCVFDLGGKNLFVAKSLMTTAGAGLIMTRPASTMEVGGSATFGGTANQLTGGTLMVSGDFTQSGSGTFAPSGTHTVKIGPNADQNQRVTFSDVGGSWFQNLTLTVAAGRTVTINSPVMVRGNFLVVGNGGTLALPVGLANQLNGPITVTGTMTLNLGGIINTSSLAFGHGTVTLTGDGQASLANGTLRLDDDLHLIVNATGNLVGGTPAQCVHGSRVTIDGANVQAVAALKLFCGIP
jgi:hypothetical protein